METEQLATEQLAPEQLVRGDLANEHKLHSPISQYSAISAETYGQGACAEPRAKTDRERSTVEDSTTPSVASHPLVDERC